MALTRVTDKQVTFKNGATDSVVLNLGDKLREVFSVKDFGATGQGSVDDAPAIRKAIAAANAARKFGNTGIYGTGPFYVGCGPTVYFPNGVYRVDTALTADTNEEVNYLKFVGEGSIIVAAAGITVFGGVSYMTAFEGLTFRNGACAISIKTNNSDAVVLAIDSCVFHEQTHSCIRSDATCQSSVLNITRCTFIQTIISTAHALKFESIDEVYLYGSWIYSNAQSQAAIYNNSGHFHLTNVLLVPSSGMALSGRWIDNYSNVYAKDTRFGGEYGGCPIVYNYTDLNFPVHAQQIGAAVTIEYCNISCNLTGTRSDAGVMVAKSGMPSVLRIVGCYSKESAPFIVDAMTTGTLAAYIASYAASIAYLSTLSIEIVNNNSIGYALTGDAPSTTALLPYTRIDQPVRAGNLTRVNNLSLAALTATSLTSNTATISGAATVGQISSVSNYTAVLGSGATADTVTTANLTFYLVTAAGDTATHQHAAAICYTDGSGIVTVLPLAVGVGISITSSGPNKITLTNGTTTQNIRWSALKIQHL